MKAKIALLLIGMLWVATVVYGAPGPPSSATVVNSTRRVTFGSGDVTVEAFAGNMTELSISTSVITRRWQGYYGNASGSITLDDANNNTLYEWGIVANPAGEFYLANATVGDWSAVQCINLSVDHPGFNCTGANEQCLNITEIENGYGMNSTDSDGVDETFNKTLGSITVGTVTLSACPLVNLYANSSASNTWNETLLTLNDTDTIIYASILEQTRQGYNNDTWHFQMIVGENGDDDVASNYFAYIELT